MTFPAALLQPPTTQAPPAPAPPNVDQMRQQIEDAMRAAREAAQNAQAEAALAQGPFPPFDSGPPEYVFVLIIVLASLAAGTIILYPLFRALGRRLERRRAGEVDADEIAPRLDRIEHAIEAMAVEVERISEGQRYVAKQVHEMRALPEPNALAQGGVHQRAAQTAGRRDPDA